MSVRQEAGVFWLTIPDSQRFFSFGVNCANLGEVNDPGSYPYTSGMTVINVVAVAGGFTYRAKKSKLSIVRGEDDNRVVGHPQFLQQRHHLTHLPVQS